jgi:type III secretory pathway component EscT
VKPIVYTIIGFLLGVVASAFFYMTSLAGYINAVHP